MIGASLNQYRIIGPLGAGGMGEVFRGRDTRLNRDVAVKVLPKDFVADADRPRRLEQEAKTLVALQFAGARGGHHFGRGQCAPVPAPGEQGMGIAIPGYVPRHRRDGADP